MNPIAREDVTQHTGSDDPLLKWTTLIADGATVDWQQVEAELDAALVPGLRQLAALADGFESTKPPVVTEAGSLAPGSSFGLLRIVDVLGRGAYGVVYRARDLQLDREVALKVLSQPQLPHAELLREGQLMARLDHPNVLKVFGAIEHGGDIGFVCELMPGEHMESWLERQGTVGAHELVAIGSELCAAVCALHRGNVLHGDLKPSNVLRHADGRWVVADFGSSQRAHDAYGSTGTPLYMAPERFQQQVPTAASDQYSLGVLLFRLATRRYPFEGETTAELQSHHHSGTRLRLLDLRPDLPRPLIAAIERALAVEPAQRHPSMGAFATALAEPAALVLPPQRRQRPWQPVAAAALLGSLAAWWWWPATPARSEDATWLRATTAGDEVLPQGTAVRLGDALALELKLDRPQHVYVINEDSHHERFQLFPLAESDLSNPLPAGRTRLPGTTDGEPVDWRITSRGGRERFYVLIADQPLADIDRLAMVQATMALGSEAMLADNGEAVRGVGGVTPRPGAAAPDTQWLSVLRTRYPGLQVRRFELANP